MCLYVCVNKIRETVAETTCDQTGCETETTKAKITTYYQRFFSLRAS